MLIGDIGSQRPEDERTGGEWAWRQDRSCCWEGGGL